MKMDQMGKATIKDVAEHLGISHSTVSRALGGRGRISAELTERIKAAARELGYVAHSGARSMRGAHSTIVGFVVPDISNTFYSKAAKVLADRCADQGHQLMLAVSEDDPHREMRHVEAFREARTSAILITPAPGVLERTGMLLEGVNVIQFVREHPRIDAQVVCVDDVAGTAVATRHLLDLGHRRIGYIGGDETLSTGRARLEGFRSAFSERGLFPDPDLICLGRPRPEFGTTSVARLLAGRPAPTALVLGSSNLMVGVIQALHETMLDVPRDLSMIGYGDPDWFAAWKPGLTTIDFSIERMVNLAASRLFDGRETGSDTAGERQIRVRPQLVIRGSAEACRNAMPVDGRPVEAV
jgi:LacI family transcriptional regulator